MTSFRVELYTNIHDLMKGISNPQNDLTELRFMIQFEGVPGAGTFIEAPNGNCASQMYTLEKVILGKHMNRLLCVPNDFGLNFNERKQTPREAWT